MKAQKSINDKTIQYGSLRLSVSATQCQMNEMPFATFPRLIELKQPNRELYLLNTIKMKIMKNNTSVYHKAIQ